MRIRLHYGVAVAMFYTAFALTTVGFVAFAMTQDVELVSPDYYERGLRHDAQMQARANADVLGDDLSVALDGHHRQITVRWPATMGPRVRGTATWYRPSGAASDREEPIVAGPDGSFVLPLAGLQPGHWRLQLRWRVGETSYYAEREFMLP